MPDWKFITQEFNTTSKQRPRGSVGSVDGTATTNLVVRLVTWVRAPLLVNLFSVFFHFFLNFPKTPVGEIPAGRVPIKISGKNISGRIPINFCGVFSCRESSFGEISFFDFGEISAGRFPIKISGKNTTRRFPVDFCGVFFCRESS